MRDDKHRIRRGLGIPTVVLGLPGWENVKVLIDRGASRLVESPEELVTILNCASEDTSFLGKWHEETKRCTLYFWEPFTAERVRELFSWVDQDQDE